MKQIKKPKFHVQDCLCSPLHMRPKYSIIRMSVDTYLNLHPMAPRLCADPDKISGQR